MSELKHIKVFDDIYDIGGSDQAVVNITRSGTTFTATRADGTTFTFTQQDLNTWQANTNTQEGYVASGSGQANKVWKTDANGNPAWRDDADTKYDSAITNITRSGTTFTATRADGTTFTFTQQDLNTWQANTSSQNGYVTSGSGHNSTVWATNASGAPSWRNSALYHNARTTSANDKHSSVTDERVTAFLATSSMTTGKPPSDAHVLHFNWDNGTATTGTWDAQLALTNNNAGMYHRSQSNGTWSSWHKIYDTNNLTAQSTNHSADGLMSNTAYRALQETYQVSGGNLTWNSSVNKTDYGTTVWKTGRNVYVYANFTLSSYSAGTLIFTLAQYYYPPISMDFNFIPNAGTEHPYARIDTLGRFFIYNFNSSTSGGIRWLFSYPSSAAQYSLP